MFCEQLVGPCGQETPYECTDVIFLHMCGIGLETDLQDFYLEYSFAHV